MRGRKTDWPRLLVDLTACFLIPAYTLLFAGSMAWFRTNFSVLAVAGKDSYRGFVLWGILAAAYFFTILLALARTLPQRRGPDCRSDAGEHRLPVSDRSPAGALPAG